MKKKMFSNTKKGQSLVEFAISLMVILFILVGAVEISLALFEYVTMRDAAQEGALYGSVNPDDIAGIKSRVVAAAADVMALDAATNIDVTYSDSSKKCEGLTGGVPHSVTVTVYRYHRLVMPIAGTFIGSNQRISMSANVTDTILSPGCP